MLNQEVHSFITHCAVMSYSTTTFKSDMSEMFFNSKYILKFCISARAILIRRSNYRN